MLYVETHTPHTGAAIQHTYVGHHDLLRAKQIRTFGNSGLYRIAPGRMLAIFPFPQLHNIQSKKNILAYTKQGLPVCGVFRKKTQQQQPECSRAKAATVSIIPLRQSLEG